MQLRKATRKQAKLRIGLSAASGFGKTYSALLMGSGITSWDKIAMIDTENGSGDLYSHLGRYNVLSLEAPYSPERYIKAIKACEDAGMELIIIDSITHEWSGKGGCLEIQKSLGGTFDAWSKVSPRHQNFIDAILQSKCHVITTVRRKQDYEMTKNDKGKWDVQKAGTKEITREGFEYELTANLEIINRKHLVKASKDRTGLFDDQPEFVITAQTGKDLIAWANEGEEVREPVRKSPTEVLEEAIQLAATAPNKESLVNVWNAHPLLQNDESFKAAMTTRKEELSPQTA